MCVRKTRKVKRQESMCYEVLDLENHWFSVLVSVALALWYYSWDCAILHCTNILQVSVRLLCLWPSDRKIIKMGLTYLSPYNLKSREVFLFVLADSCDCVKTKFCI